MVTSPDGNSVVHYFMAYPGDWDYALPYTRQYEDPISADGRTHYLSREQYAGAVTLDEDTGALSGGTKVRSTYLEFGNDVLPPYAPAGGHRHFNRHLVSELSVYDDDPLPGGGKRWTQSLLEEFDGLGHFRRRTRKGAFESGSPLTLTSFVGYNPTGSETPRYRIFGVDYLPWPATEGWILGTYDATGLGSSGLAERTEFCFERSDTFYPTTGFLRGKRTMLGSTANSKDLVAVFTRDSRGNVVAEQYLGGDTQSGAPATGCTTEATARVWGERYRVDHTFTYQSYHLTALRSQYVIPGGSGTPFGPLLRDVSLDWPTGLTAKVRTATDGTTSNPGIESQAAFDSSGRIVSVIPGAGAAPTTYAYHRVWEDAQTDHPWVEVVRTPGGSEDPTRQELHYDLLGRLTKQRQLQPSTSCGALPACYSRRLLEYDPMGRRTRSSVTEADNQQTVTRWTEQRYCTDTAPVTCDPLGRVLKVIPPDGSGHAVSFSYAGARETTRTARIATSVSTESDVSTTETYDALGRLAKVTENSGQPGSTRVTTYGHDLTGRLVDVMLGASSPQVRHFQYDGRGLLLRELHPEMGPAGTDCQANHDTVPECWVQYPAYDPRGHLLRKRDGTNYLLYSYDQAERLIQVDKGTSSWAVAGNLQSLTYDTLGGTARGQSLGRVVRGTMHNLSPAGDIPVTETYTYAGTGGAVSERVSSVSYPGSATAEFVQRFEWTALGRPATVDYPWRPGMTEPQRRVYYAYDNGWTSAVLPYYATSVGYHANGLPFEVRHARREAEAEDGAADQLGPDPFGMPRLGSVTVRAPDGSQLWSTGAFSFDGSGNVKTIGTAAQAYDRLGRLVSGQVTDSAGATRTQTAAYDTYGNLVSIASPGRATASWPVSGRTNRLSGASYDASGNVTSLLGVSYTWDPLGRVVGATGTGVQAVYAYTVDGERALVKDLAGGTTTYTIRDTTGQVLREVGSDSAGWSWKDYVYRDGILTTTVGSREGIRHVHVDQLGSSRVITDRCGSLVTKLATLPFGQEPLPPSSSSPEAEERLRFTGHERDNRLRDRESDTVDYMHARSYSPVAGRFLSVDPIGGDPRRPGSWNRYAYVLGNPQTLVDPTGMYVVDCAASGLGDEQCASLSSRFEAERRRLLTSEDEDLHRAGAAYGKPGEDNGITVKFGAPKQDKWADAEVEQWPAFDSASGAFTGKVAATATFLPELGGTRLRAAVAHEGQHLVDGAAFAATVNPDGSYPSLELNLQKYFHELKAWRLTHKVYAGDRDISSVDGCGSGTTCRIGPGVANPDPAIRRILSYRYQGVDAKHPGDRMFGDPWNKPPRGAE